MDLTPFAQPLTSLDGVRLYRWSDAGVVAELLLVPIAADDQTAYTPYVRINDKPFAQGYSAEPILLDRPFKVCVPGKWEELEISSADGYASLMWGPAQLVLVPEPTLPTEYEPLPVLQAGRAVIAESPDSGLLLVTVYSRTQFGPADKYTTRYFVYSGDTGKTVMVATDSTAAVLETQMSGGSPIAIKFGDTPWFPGGGWLVIHMLATMGSYDADTIRLKRVEANQVSLAYSVTETGDLTVTATRH